MKIKYFVFLVGFIVVAFGLKKMIWQHDKNESTKKHELLVDELGRAKSGVRTNVSESNFKTSKINTKQQSIDKQTLLTSNDGVDNQKETDAVDSLAPELISNIYRYTPKAKEFFDGMRKARSKSEITLNEYYINSVFKRDPDPNWSQGSEKKLELIFNAMQEKYSFKKNIVSIVCSDVMCFVGMKFKPKLPPFELNKQIVVNGGFPTYAIISKPKSARGLYLFRYKQRYNIYGSN